MNGAAILMRDQRSSDRVLLSFSGRVWLAGPVIYKSEQLGHWNAPIRLPVSSFFRELPSTWAHLTENPGFIPTQL
jgi:hypothetical protein